ncbi:MAG: rRNA maturation RNase YbeY [Planctomycetia bacterium]|nr:rRNA maturation RNase YbeY [Planctomycetia bacterium]
MYQIYFTDEQTAIVMEESRIHDAVFAALRYGKIRDAEISVALVDDPAIHEINRQFLQHDCPTDVISFPLSDSPKRLEGEIVVSTDTALRESKKIGRGWTPECEVLLYIIHGTLHLTGLDDHTLKDLAEMRQGEVDCLRAVGIDVPEGLHDKD